MKKKLLGTVSVLAGVCILASCASVKVQSWTEPAFEGRQLSKVAVMGVTQSDSIRRRYEDTFAQGLIEAGLEAVASYTVLPQTKKLTKAAVQAALAKTGADSVIVTRVLSEHDEVRYDASDVYPGYYGSYYGFYDWSYNYMASPGYVETYVETALESNLYDVKSGKLVWTGRSKITDEYSDKQNIHGIVRATIKNLRKQGMIPPVPKK